MRKNRLRNGNPNIFGLGEDVMLGLFLAVFTFSTVLILLIRTGAPPLEIHTDCLPDAVAYNKYTAGIGVSGGVGKYTFTISDEEFPPGLSLADTNNGLIEGIPRVNALTSVGRSRVWKLHVAVRDQAGHTAEKTVSLKIFPTAVPFDPEEQKLRFSVQQSRLPDAWIGKPYEASLGVLGGIEAYSIRIRDLPSGLSFDGERIHGTPDESSVPQDMLRLEQKVSVAVVDQQGVVVNGATSAPRLNREFAICVHRITPMRLEGVFPQTALAGQSYRGAIVAHGGNGNLRWKEFSNRDAGSALGSNPTGLADLGLSLDANTGILHGTIDQQIAKDGNVALVTFSILVDDQDSSTDPVQANIALRVLPPMHFSESP